MHLRFDMKASLLFDGLWFGQKGREFEQNTFLVSYVEEIERKVKSLLMEANVESNFGLSYISFTSSDKKLSDNKLKQCQAPCKWANMVHR